MAAATTPPATRFSGPSSTRESVPLEPPGDILYEVVNGRIVESPPMESYESDLNFFLASALDHFVKEQRLGKVVVELLFLIDLDQKLKRRPDLAFVSVARWPFGKWVPEGEAWEMVPDLAVEVVSKANTSDEILKKLAEYFRTGTRLVWVVYPRARQVYVYTSPTDVRILPESAEIDGGEVVPGFRLPLRRLFEDETAEPSR